MIAEMQNIPKLKTALCSPYQMISVAKNFGESTVGRSMKPCFLSLPSQKKICWRSFSRWALGTQKIIIQQSFIISSNLLMSYL